MKSIKLVMTVTRKISPEEEVSEEEYKEIKDSFLAEMEADGWEASFEYEEWEE